MKELNKVILYCTKQLRFGTDAFEVVTCKAEKDDKKRYYEAMGYAVTEKSN